MHSFPALGICSVEVRVARQLEQRPFRVLPGVMQLNLFQVRSPDRSQTRSPCWRGRVSEATRPVPQSRCGRTHDLSGSLQSLRAADPDGPGFEQVRDAELGSCVQHSRAQQPEADFQQFSGGIGQRPGGRLGVRYQVMNSKKLSQRGGISPRTNGSRSFSRK
jgi:hypothetical protein